MPANNAKYQLPHNIYIQVKAFIRSYPSLQKRYEKASVKKSAPSDGMPRGSKIGDSTASMAIQMAEISKEMDVIYKPLFDVPVFYRDAVWAHLIYRDPFPDFAAVSTWRRWQYRYIFFVYQKGLETYGEEFEKKIKKKV